MNTQRSTLLLRSAPMNRIRTAVSLVRTRFGDDPLDMLVQEGFAQEASSLEGVRRIHTLPGAWFTEFDTDLALLKRYQRIVVVYNSPDQNEYSNLHRILYLSGVRELYGVPPSGGLVRLQPRSDGSLPESSGRRIVRLTQLSGAILENLLLAVWLALLTISYPLYFWVKKSPTRTTRLGLRRITLLYYQLADELAKNTCDHAGTELSCLHAQTMWELLRRLTDCDVLYVNPARRNRLSDVLGVYIALLLGRLFGKYTIGFLANEYVDLVTNPVARALFFAINWICFRQFDKVYVLPSRAYIARRYRLKDDRVAYVENYPPVHTVLQHSSSPWSHVPRNRFIFLYHGNILWYHGFLKFVRVFTAIRRQRPDALLLVVGPVKATLFNMLFSRERALLREVQRIRSRPWQKSGIYFTGQWLPKGILQQLARQSHIHVSQLDSESRIGDTELRTCLLEAMQWGMACLHCDSSAVREHSCFVDGENILLIDPNDVEGATEKLLHYMDNPQMLTRIGDRARETVRTTFGFETWCNQEFRPMLDELVAPRISRVEPFGVGTVAAGLASCPAGRCPKVLIIASCRPQHLRRIHRSFDSWDVSCLVQRTRYGLVQHLTWGQLYVTEGQRFSLWNVGLTLLRKLRSERFDLVVVPWSNPDGTGYSNVEVLALSVGASSVVGCTIDGFIRVLSPFSVVSTALREQFHSTCDRIADRVLCRVVLWCYRAGFRFSGKKAVTHEELRKAA